MIKIIDCMQPMMKKFARQAYWAEYEDVQQELTVAVLEAVSKLEHWDNEGEIIVFIANAIRNRYFEMFRKNKGKMLEESFNEVLLDTLESKDIYCYHNVEFLIDLNRMICLENGSKAKMIDYILQEQKSDREIAIQLNVSRQYVNRCKKEIFQKLLEYHQNG